MLKEVCKKSWSWRPWKLPRYFQIEQWGNLGIIIVCASSECNHQKKDKRRRRGEERRREEKEEKEEEKSESEAEESRLSTLESVQKSKSNQNDVA